MTSIQTTTLANGLRIITDHVPSVESVALGIWAGVGTRDEDMANNGVAHMVEHLLFKGTKKRNALEIVEVIENVGGHMNAYTSREITSYHIHGLKKDLPLMVDVLADMYQSSTLPEDEIEREREVILQEIGMCNDTPDDLIFDHYYETAYAGQAFGAPILGTAEIIKKMPKTALQNHIDTHYCAQKTVISAAGNLDHDAFVQMIKDQFLGLSQQESESKNLAQYTGGEHRMEKELEQAHIVLGFKGLSLNDEDYYAAQAMAALFGGGMSSRLFQEVREKRGLVYSVYAYHAAHSDDGQLIIYAGTGPDKLPEIMPVICDEVVKLADTLREEEIERARNQLKSSLLMGRESMMTRANQQAKHLLLREGDFDPDKMATKIEAVDKAAISRVAQRIFTSTPTLASLGPISALEEFEKIKQRLAA